MKNKTNENVESGSGNFNANDVKSFEDPIPERYVTENDFIQNINHEQDLLDVVEKEKALNKMAKFESQQSEIEHEQDYVQMKSDDVIVGNKRGQQSSSDLNSPDFKKPIEPKNIDNSMLLSSAQTLEAELSPDVISKLR